MTHHDPDHIEVAFLRRWFPDLPEDEMRQAEKTYLRYLEIRLRIYERIAREKHDNPQVGLTDSDLYGIDSYKGV